MEALKKELSEEGVCPGKLGKLHNPAGLDINARTPSEIALSILAEIVQQLRSETEKPTVTTTETEKAIDLVCGMEVRVEDAHYVSLLEGKHFYFCCSGCKTKFEKDPQNFMVSG